MTRKPTLFDGVEFRDLCLAAREKHGNIAVRCNASTWVARIVRVVGTGSILSERQCVVGRSKLGPDHAVRRCLENAKRGRWQRVRRFRDSAGDPA